MTGLEQSVDGLVLVASTVIRTESVPLVCLRRERILAQKEEQVLEGTLNRIA